MTLAARPGTTPGRSGGVGEINPETGQRRDSGLGKEGKARQRDRNKDSDTAKLTNNSGSSGKAKGISALPRHDFDEVFPLTTHLGDIAAKITHTQVGGTGWCSASLAVPLAYIPEIMEAHVASQRGLIFIRVYHIDIEDYMRGLTSDEEGEDGSIDGEDG